MATLGYTRTQAHWVDGEAGGTRADAIDLENWDQLGLMTNNTRIEFVWNGTTYVLPKYTPPGGVSLADTSRLRDFHGPMDPEDVPGLILGERDRWFPTT